MLIPVANELKSESLQLLREYYKSPCVEIRNQLVELNFGLVRKVANRVANQYTESYEDLFQVGSIGLIRAIERFKPDHGSAFSSFAIPYIRGELLHYLRDNLVYRNRDPISFNTPMRDEDEIDFSGRFGS